MYSSELHFKKFPRIFFFYSILLVLPYICYTQYRPSLLFREDSKEIPPTIPVTQEYVANENLILKLADVTWLISDLCDDQSKDWRICEFNIIDMNWYSFNIERISEEKSIKNPDLSKVDEIGFADLMCGGRSSAYSRIDWFEVYGRSVERNPVIH